MFGWCVQGHCLGGVFRVTGLVAGEPSRGTELLESGSAPFSIPASSKGSSSEASRGFYHISLILASLQLTVAVQFRTDNFAPSNLSE